MGYMKHSITCIAVGGYEKEKLGELDAYVSQLGTTFGGILVKTHSVVNDIWFYTLLPDGSKEGWDESDRIDDVRRHLVKCQPRDAVDVFWGGDDPSERGFNNDVPASEED